MGKHSNIFVAGNFIARQDIGTQILHAEHVHTNTPSAPTPHEVEDVAFESVLDIPREGKYTEVRRYIEERKRFDTEFKSYCAEHSLRDLCHRLTNEFGWFVDENSLQRNLNRDLKKKQ